MALFEGAREKFTDTARAAVKASREFVEVSKLNTAIKCEEDKMKALMLEIGQAVYETYKDNKPVEMELNVICGEIMECERIIEELRKKVLEIRNLRQCSGCLAKVERNFVYCPKCGTRLFD